MADVRANVAAVTCRLFEKAHPVVITSFKQYVDQSGGS